MAVRALIETFEVLAIQAANSGAVLPIEKRLLDSITEANRVVRTAADENPELHSMGTTLVCACLDGDRIVIGNVGDSRAYLVRNGACIQITLDHSLLDEQLRQGLITPEMAAASNLQSVITRAIGTAHEVEADLFAAQLNLNDMFLLTSDGLTRYARPEEIAQAAAPDAELATICQTLIDHAKQRGGADNITCMMLRVVETPAVQVESPETLTEAAPAEYDEADFQDEVRPSEIEPSSSVISSELQR
jgi:protein phosphatase